MKISEVPYILDACVEADDTLMMTGVHGIGKSQIVERWASDRGYHCETLFLSQQEVADLIGIPVTLEKNGVTQTVWSAPSWLQNIFEAASKGIRSVVFCDELNRAELSVLQAALQLVLERKLHQHSLPVVDGYRTMVVAAINPTDGYMTNDLDIALKDRFMKIEVEPDAESWVEWARSNGINAVVCDFIAEYPDRIWWMSEDGEEACTPRSWTKMSAFINTFRLIPERLHFVLIKGRLGSTIGSQFYQFMQNYSHTVKLEDVVALAEKTWKETENIENVAEKIKDITSRMEKIQHIDNCKQLFKTYMPDAENREDIIPLLGYLYSLDLENLASVFSNFKNTESALYFKLAKLDFNKALFKRIV